jgi:hypothetical protein
MRTALSVSAGWFAVPLIGLIGVAYMCVVSRILGQQPEGRKPRNRAVRGLLRFTDIYALFGVGPFKRDEWPVLQSAANDDENQTLARLKARRRTTT